MAGNPREEKKQHRVLQHWQIVALCLAFYDICVMHFAYFLGLWLRFDFVFSQIPQFYLDAYLAFMPIYTLGSLLIFLVFHLYRFMWQFASFKELWRILSACLLTTVFHVVGTLLFVRRMPISYYLVGAVAQTVLMVLIRFSYRFFIREQLERSRRNPERKVKRAMIIGAGFAGQMILRELLHNRSLGVAPCCIIDDDPNKLNRSIEGIPIVGTREDILYNAKFYKIDQILYAIPSASSEEKREILGVCKESGCELKTLPSLSQLVSGDVLLSRMKPVDVADLLGREPISVNLEEIGGYLTDKTVLVTGAGGSIGSELCRQIAAHHPKKLLLFDIYENNVYAVDLELKECDPHLDCTPLIGSVQDLCRLDRIFDRYRPDLVYHAAAHKHVPLMEGSPCESIKNNVVGTYNTACMALKYGAKRFVLISTDKAVNPTNIMGASKRLCEMVIQSLNEVSMEGAEDSLPRLYAALGGVAPANFARKIAPEKTEFVAVRFGNVLESNGSVIPIFKHQIEQGGPVTVTHPDIIRYFMTIPEAVRLVLQAGAYAKGGELFVLNMGKPVKIDSLARNLIRLSGYQPDVDIKVVYTGLRPGEKLYEEPLMDEENMGTTANRLIFIGQPLTFNRQEFFEQLIELSKAAYENCADMKLLVSKVVTTYRPDERGEEE